MLLFVCCIRDSAVQAFGRPIFVNAPGQAMRSFQDEVNRAAQDNDLHKHPSDFELYQVGEWDDATGSFSNGSGPVLLMRGKDVVQAKE